MKKLVILFTFLTMTTLLAEISVEGESWTNSCAYYSSQETYIDLTYTDKNLPWNTKVDLVFAFERTELSTEGAVTPWWEKTKSLEMKASAPYTWGITLVKQTHSRGQSYKLSGMDFVVLVSGADGKQKWVKGNDSTNGYYKVEFTMPFPCQNPTEEPQSQLQTLKVETVEKW